MKSMLAILGNESVNPKWREKILTILLPLRPRHCDTTTEILNYAKFHEGICPNNPCSIRENGMNSVEILCCNTSIVNRCLYQK